MFIIENFWLLLIPALTGVSALVLLTQKPKWNDYLAFGVIVGGVLMAYTLLHPRQTVLLGDAQKVRDMIGTGVPVLVEFQSPY